MNSSRSAGYVHAPEAPKRIAGRSRGRQRRHAKFLPGAVEKHGNAWRKLQIVVANYSVLIVNNFVITLIPDLRPPGAVFSDLDRMGNDGISHAVFYLVHGL